MVTRDAILEYAKLFQMPPYQVEKEYFQHLLLFLIFSNSSNLVFKGGTAIKKAYGLPRFSEDLDFTQIQESNLDELLTKTSKLMKDKFGVENEVKKIPTRGKGVTYRFKILGPLVSSPKQIDACFIYIEISARETTKTREIISIDPQYSDLPSYTMIVMSKEEILSEKVRAILTRTKCRDAFDLWYLLKISTEIKVDLIREKLLYYQMEFAKEKFFKELQKFSGVWQKEMPTLVKIVPPFEEVAKLIIAKFNE